MSKQLKLTPTAFKQAEYVRNVFAVTPENGTPYEALLEPSYWSHVAAQLRPQDKIEVIAEDQSYYALLLVTSANKLSAKVAPIQYNDLQNAIEDEAPQAVAHAIKYAGVKAKWRVYRVSDNQPLRDGFSSKDDAQTWLNQYEKTHDLC